MTSRQTLPKQSLSPSEGLATSQLDAIDVGILRELQADGRLSIVDLAARVGLSPSPCLRRVRNLEERGVILGYRAMIDPAKIGLTLQFLVSFRVDIRSMDERRKLRKALLGFPEVVSVHSVTGDADAVLRVAVPSFDAYERFLEEKLWPLPVKDVLSRFIINTRKPSAVYDLSHIEAAAEPAQSAVAALAEGAPARRRRND